MLAKRQIFLIGFMASGKSVIAKQLAKRLGYEFIDLDTEIERETGLSISDIFKLKGEEEFRKIEFSQLNNICNNRDNFVMATGGGAACSEDALDLMQVGLTIYLKLPVHIILGRLRQKRNERPLVASIPDDELLPYIKDKLAERSVFYEQAKLIVNAENLKVSELSELVEGQLK